MSTPVERIEITDKVYITKSETDGIFLHWPNHGVRLMSDAAAQAFAAALQPQGWQPISTAPKGSMEKPIWIIGCNQHTGEAAKMSWCEADDDHDLEEGWSDENENMYEPTHWQLPPAPVEGR